MSPTPGATHFPDDLRVLVNNAGADSDYLPVEHSDLDDWRALFETNVLGVVGPTMAAIPTLRANRPAVVCNVTSSSILASVPFYSAYRATKAAVSAFGDTLRVELGPSGIRVVEILPGPIDTDMFRLSTGEPAAARFDRYRPMAEQAARLRTETRRSRWWPHRPTPPCSSWTPSWMTAGPCATAATRCPSACSTSGASPTTKPCSASPASPSST